MNRIDHVLLVLFCVLFFCTLMSHMSWQEIAATDVIGAIIFISIAEWRDRHINQERGS